METIYKYPLEVEDEQTIGIPTGAKVLTVQTQHGAVFLWVRCNSSSRETPRTFITRGTGQPLPEDTGAYIGTYQLNGGALVFHVFEKIAKGYPPC